MLHENGWGAILVASFSVFACGGESSSSGPQSCPAPVPCGGDIVGTWELADSCLSSPQSMALDSCPGVTATIESTSLSGTWTFTVDGNEISSGTESGSVRYSFPTSCLKQACADTAAALSSAPSGDGSTLTGAACSANGDTCVCTASIGGNVDDHDTYTTNGSELRTVSGTDGTTDTSTYCVQGNELTASERGIVIHATKR